MNYSNKKIFQIIDRIICVFISLSLVVMINSGCIDDNSNLQVDFSKRSTDTININLDSNSSPLYIAVSAMISPKKTFLYYNQMIDYVSQKIKRKIVFKQRKTYKEVNELLENGELDFAFICSGAYVDAYAEFGIEILAIPIVNGEPFYYSYIITNISNAFTTFYDLKNHTFAFTDPLSNTGKLYPEYLVASQGYSVDSYFSKIVYTYAHDNSILAVNRNLVDGASVDGLVFEYFKMKNPETVKNVRVVLKSEPFGMPPVVVRKNLEESLKNKLRKVFLNMHKSEEGKEILSNINIDRFELGNDQNYDSIRKMKNSLKK